MDGLSWGRGILKRLHSSGGVVSWRFSVAYIGSRPRCQSGDTFRCFLIDRSAVMMFVTSVYRCLRKTMLRLGSAEGDVVPVWRDIATNIY
jgi:hypothetical protein